MEPVVALHGFAGTGAMWRAVDEAYIAPDLPGHGSASAVRPVSFDACVEQVLAAAPQRFVLAGYSLGGRVAQHVALAAPERVARLVLIATTAGIEDDAARAERRASDAVFADEVERGTVEDFVRRWSALPLFAGDPPEAVAAWQADMRRNEPAGLAAALRGIGTGSMAPLWDRLGELTMPATIVTGERDAKFRALGERLAAALGAELVTVPGAGHGVPREAPRAVAAAIAG